MPKMKTHRGAAKRFRKTPRGKIMRRKAFRAHILEKKTGKRKRRLALPATVSPQDEKKVRRMLGG
ncbi:MAG: 50S ribosomal protein L35 [Actinomycetota bacterium]|nr:50S ribosomal protein L35 [Actinomycetota bacterium]